MKKWQRIGEPELLHDGWRKVFQKTFKMPNGKKMVAEVVGKDGMLATAAIALTPDNKVIISEQFRCGPEEVFHELPGGIVDSGETSREAVVRELEEETGYKAGRIVRLGKVFKNGWMSSSWEYYLLYDCVPSENGRKLDEFEAIDVSLITIGELFDVAKQGRMTDTEAVFFAYEQLKELEGKSHE